MKEKFPEASNQEASRFYKLTAERLSSPFEYPEPKKQLVVVSGNYKLLAALSALAEDENAQLRHARQGTPDILVFSGAVKVIDRPYLGKEAWEDFCEYLEQVNEESPFFQQDEEGELLFEEPIYDETPLIIIDNDLESSRKVFKTPAKARGGVYYIRQQSVERIVQLARKLLRTGSAEVCMVKALRETDKREL